MLLQFRAIYALAFSIFDCLFRCVCRKIHRRVCNAELQRRHPKLPDKPRLRLQRQLLQPHAAAPSVGSAGVRFDSFTKIPHLSYTPILQSTYKSPKCGCTEYYPFRGRNAFQCRACRHQTSVTAGTLMHRTHLPLTVWFWAIYLCATDKRGISAVQLSRTLGICYESAWYLLHRIRAAMGKRDEKYELSGIVEMDDGYVGRVTRNGRRLSAASGGQDEGCGVCSDATPPPLRFFLSTVNGAFFLIRERKRR